MIITTTFDIPLEHILGNVSKEEWEEEKKKLSKWVQYEACATVEFDTDKMIATVLEAGR